MPSVPLREHLEAAAAAEKERVNLLFSIAVAAAAFVWVEIMRRLGVLNHAHQEAIEVGKTTVRDDIYQQDKIVRDEKIDGIEQEQARTRTARVTTIAIVTGASVVLGIIVLFANGKF